MKVYLEGDVLYIEAVAQIYKYTPGVGWYYKTYDKHLFWRTVTELPEYIEDSVPKLYKLLYLDDYEISRKF